ncbi:hypothetical protein [Leptospira noguchii]|uniref:hypothetical protein n=1 Tax=Leptospira noguchii TaxID=28182 RepID=UPI001FB7E89F|nr:hypothetical protein [Leptospira noguchii]UOG49093.1 hypothetical protein MAL00_01830 [Leptospira noguchii]
MTTKFTIKNVEMNKKEGLTGILVLVPVKDLSTSSLSKVLQDWVEILKDAKELILSDQIFENSDPWFGFGIFLNDDILFEQDIFFKIPKEENEKFKTATIEYVNAIIRYNKDDGEGLLTHEELETGTYAILWLLEKDLQFLSLYLEYLSSLDLDHMAAQLDVLFRLTKLYSPSDLEPLKNFAKENYVQQFDNWLEDDRAWKK